MTAATQKANTELVTQEHCIDLPGESVQCWIGGGTDKLKVVLRKHRDVIFDIRLGNGKTYTLETTESDFYNARDKKLVYAARNGKVSFSDGERMHVWVSRGFRGALLLKCADELICKIEPNEWDTHRYSDDPKEKPLPIIIALGQDPSPPAPPVTSKQITPATSVSSKASQQPKLPRTASAPIEDESHPVICILDCQEKGMPDHVAKYFKEGGEGTGLVDFDPFDIATRNWIWGQIAGVGAFIKDNWAWLRASLDSKTHKGFRLVSAKLSKAMLAKGKIRIYFSGYSNTNTIFRGGGYSPAHDTIKTIFAGAGKTSSTIYAAAKNIISSFKSFALISLVFGTATAYAEWMNDAKKDGYDFMAALLTMLIKTVIVTALATAVIAILVAAIFLATTFSVPVIAVGAFTIGLTAAIGYGVEAMDKSIGKYATGDEKNTDGTAAVIAPFLRNAGEKIQENWTLLVKKFPKDYMEIAF